MRSASYMLLLVRPAAIAGVTYTTVEVTYTTVEVSYTTVEVTSLSHHRGESVNQSSRLVMFVSLDVPLATCSSVCLSDSIAGVNGR